MQWDAKTLSAPIRALKTPPLASQTSTDEATLAPQGGVSYVSGDRRQPLLRLTLPALLQRAKQEHGSREALIFLEQDLRWSYSEFARKVDDFAAGLLALGLKAGDRVGIWSPNRVEWVVTQFATARLGLILVNINPAYRLAELRYALEQVGCKALVTAAEHQGADYLAMLQKLCPELEHCPPGALHAAQLPQLQIVIRMGDEATAGMLNYAQVAALGGPAQRLRLDGLSAALDADEPINIQFTSGTTGSPKGATLTHYNIVNNGHQVIRGMQLEAQDKLCIPVPLYHCFGMVMGVVGCVSVGAAMVFPAASFDAETTLQAIDRERCTAIYSVPTMFAAMLESPLLRSVNLLSLRTGVNGGAPCPIEMMRRLIETMHLPQITIAYGMTETSPVSFQTHVDDDLERKVATVGRVHPHVEVKIVDARGRTVPIGARGELCTRGYSVMHGYWNDEKRSTEAIDAAGWMHSGDLATIDAQGYCRIVGRVKDMIIRGGENIYPREIEEFLFTHPHVQDAQVFGIPDAKYGEQVCVWIVPKPGASLGAEAIAKFCEGQIARYKMPRVIRIREALPITVTGKPQKFVMREQMIVELGLQQQNGA